MGKQGDGERRAPDSWRTVEMSELWAAITAGFEADDDAEAVGSDVSSSVRGGASGGAGDRTQGNVGDDASNEISSGGNGHVQGDGDSDAGDHTRQRRVVAVDGRSGSGKTTLADQLAALCGDHTFIVHTDDLAWYEPMFDWFQLLTDSILKPLQDGGSVSFTPPEWVRRGRTGSIDVPSDVETLIIEGAGSSCKAVADFLDAAIWVRSDRVEAKRRGIERDVADNANGDREECVAFWDSWDEDERRFFAADKPWERADFIVDGTSSTAFQPGMVTMKAGPADADDSSASVSTNHV